MKAFFTISILALLFSCGSLENTTQKTKLEFPVSELNEGLVFVNSDNCSTFIKVKEAGTEVLLYPTNLPKQFNQEGLTIYFKYSLSDYTPNTDCVVNKVVRLESIRLK